MILASASVSPPACIRATDRTQGDVGGALCASIAKASMSREFEARRTEVYRRVSAALHQASSSDGTFASPEAIGRTIELLNLLPSTVPLPDVVVESDSEIGLDWDEGARRVVSLTVRDNPMVGFSALLGAEPLYGRTPFAGEVPRTIQFLLRRLYYPTRRD
jgi:hypothetical protein